MAKVFLLSGAADSEQRSERGTAIFEFVLSLPFLVSMLFGVIDITLMIKEYYFLIEAVSQGAQRAMTAPELTPGVEFTTGTRVGCSGQSSTNHDRIHERIGVLISLQNASLTDLCILSERVDASALATERNTVLVQAVATYEGLFPAFKGLTISAQVRVPYLLNPA